MLLRWLLGSPSKITCQPHTLISRVFSIIPNDTIVTTSTSLNNEEDDFFGITENDSYNRGKVFMPDSNEDDLSKEAILTKHVSTHVWKNEMEKYISTKFGKIRFDWQNTAPPKVRKIASNKTKESHQSYGDVDYFSEMYFRDSLGEETLENSNINTTTVNDRSTVKNGDISPEISAKDDMDCIDYQYFGNYIENVAQSPNFPNLNSVNVVEQEEDIYPHEQLLDLKKSSSNRVNFTNDYNFIESQYFSNSAPNILQAKSDTNASTKSSKANLTVDAAKKYFTENSPLNTFDNDNFRVPEFESFQNAGGQTCNPKPQNTFEASQKIRREIKRKNEGPLVDSKGFRILKDQVNDLTILTTYEIANHLKSRILYNKNDLIVIDKPYGLPSHGGPGINVNVAKALPELAKKIHYSGDLHLIHRLDKETTGVMLLAKTDKMAHTIKDMFQKRLIIKTYWALTKGIPNPSRGVIEIPIAEGSVDGKHRMVLRPEFNKEAYIMKKSRVESHQAITHYQVLNSSFNCALVECKTETGIKHQVRVHLGFGLNTPILGDHKYSHLTKMAPQRLFPEILEHLHIRQSKVRHLPMHLHASSMILPEVINGQNLIFKAPLPFHFRKNMRSLKFRKSETQEK